jgi:hypothetical protein
MESTTKSPIYNHFQVTPSLRLKTGPDRPTLTLRLKIPQLLWAHFLILYYPSFFGVRPATNKSTGLTSPCRYPFQVSQFNPSLPSAVNLYAADLLSLSLSLSSPFPPLPGNSQRALHHPRVRRARPLLRAEPQQDGRVQPLLVDDPRGTPPKPPRAEMISALERELAVGNHPRTRVARHSPAGSLEAPAARQHIRWLSHCLLSPRAGAQPLAGLAPRARGLRDHLRDEHPGRRGACFGFHPTMGFIY